MLSFDRCAFLGGRRSTLRLFGRLGDGLLGLGLAGCRAFSALGSGSFGSFRLGCGLGLGGSSSGFGLGLSSLSGGAGLALDAFLAFLLYRFGIAALHDLAQN